MVENPQKLDKRIFADGDVEGSAEWRILEPDR